VRRLALALPVLLCGCAGLPDYKPYVVVADAPQYQRDDAYCRHVAALDPNSGLSTGAIAGQGGKGAASNLPASLPAMGTSTKGMNWFVILFGAIGGSLGEVSEELHVTDVRQQRIFLKCLDKITERDRSGLVVEPEPIQQ